MTMNGIRERPAAVPWADLRHPGFSTKAAPAGNEAISPIRGCETIPLGDFEAVRREWRAAAYPLSPDERSYDLLRRTFAEWGNQKLGEYYANLGKDTPETGIAFAPSFQEFVSSEKRLEEPEHRVSVGGETITVPISSYIVYGPKSAQYAILANRPEGILVVPILFGGFDYATEVAAVLQSKGKLAGVLFVSYSTGLYDAHREEGYHKFKDGSSMLRKMLLPPDASDILARNRGNPVLIVDDSRGTTGITSWAVESWLRDMGFREVLMIERWSSRIYL
jgi:hypothetical protein